MPRQKAVLSVVGARPQFIKAAPVSRALTAAGLRDIIVHTGQHFDPLMSDVFFQELGIPNPSYNLEVNSLSHGAMTGRMLERLEAVMLSEKPDSVVIYGDTNSTVAAALAAAKLHIPIAHVEAGLRSFNRRMPEEINRIVADQLSELLLCPTRAAVENLAAEGIKAGVFHVGDVMYDTALFATEQARAQSNILTRLGLTPRGYRVATIHRAETTDDTVKFAAVLAWLEALPLTDGGPIIMPLHPRTRKLLDATGRVLRDVTVIDPLGYLDMTWLVHNSSGVLTDSGGLQKEAYFHRVPCVTLRDETEWVETIESGWNRLWMTPSFSLPRREITDYGTGNSAAAIATLVAGLG